MEHIERLNNLKELIFKSDNKACFIEREHFLNSVRCEKPEAQILAEMLEEVSVYVDENDVFVGRAVEALPDFKCEGPSEKIASVGHLTPDYNRLLTKGYKGILEEIEQNARRISTSEAEDYLQNAKTVVEAIKSFALRYAEEAKKVGNFKAYEALLKVPFEPAYDMFSALQSIWLVHFISSCYVGARDYAFGYMDEYLYPFYLAELKKGTTKEEITEMLSAFFIKTNEICGRNTHNFNPKPVPCQAAKQYVLLDGGRANELSNLILEAVMLNAMPQPETTVILSSNAPAWFKDRVFYALNALTDKLQVYNFELLKSFLAEKGMPREICNRPSFSACCTFDLSYHAIREEYFCPTVKIFTDLIFNTQFSSKSELLSAYFAEVTRACENEFNSTRTAECYWQNPKAFFMDSLLIGDCNLNCSFPPRGLRYRCKNVFLMGIATLGDSLLVLDKTVFNGRMKYSDFIEMLKADFRGYEKEFAEIKAIVKFGNDTENDLYTQEMAEGLVKAVENAKHQENEIIVAGFYSLTNENDGCVSIPATPNGRMAGTPFSENQSPTYGEDKNGVTALLNSLSRLPFGKAIAGGLNLTFSRKPGSDILKALVITYFESGGLHVGITVLNRAELEDAIINPEKYPTLTVRLYGFSEYFISLPKWQQQAVINRTALEN